MRLYVSPLWIALLTALLIPISAGAQTRVDEGVCDGLSGASWGLCNAYCEVMDCDSESAKASPRACSRVLARFAKHSDESIPCAPVECQFDVDGTYCFCNTSTVTCLSIPPVCPPGTVLATQVNCWECVDPTTCNPI
jgi:hypothetical protein